MIVTASPQIFRRSGHDHCCRPARRPARPQQAPRQPQRTQLPPGSCPTDNGHHRGRLPTLRGERDAHGALPSVRSCTLDEPVPPSRRPATGIGAGANDVAAAAAYCGYVITAVTVTGAVLLIALIAAGVGWTARLVQVGTLDALALSAKVGTPEPVSALDWPELHVRAVVAQPDEPSLVLLRVGWPAHPELAATLLVALDDGDQQSLVLLSQWCTTRASVSPTRRGDRELELRRRQSLERVHGVLIAEDAAPGATARSGGRHGPAAGG
jgi:hypothetical protein